MSETVNLTMTDLTDVAALVDVAPDSTVSLTVLKAEGARLVLFSFDTGQELTEHTAAMPVFLQAHAVLAKAPSRLLLTMLDPRQS